MQLAMLLYCLGAMDQNAETPLPSQLNYGQVNDYTLFSSRNTYMSSVHTSICSLSNSG